MKVTTPTCNCSYNGFLSLGLLGSIAAWTHGWGFWAGLFWEYWLAVAIIRALS